MAILRESVVAPDLQPVFLPRLSPDVVLFSVPNPVFALFC